MDEVEVECKTPGTYPNLDDIIVEGKSPSLLLDIFMIARAADMITSLCQSSEPSKSEKILSGVQAVCFRSSHTALMGGPGILG